MPKCRCPGCQSLLTVADGASKAKCPKCKRVFPAPDSEAEAFAPKRMPVKRRDRQQENEGDDIDVLRPTRRERSRRERSAAGVGALLIAAIIAGSVLIVAGLGIGIYYFVSSSNPAPVAAENRAAPRPAFDPAVVLPEQAQPPGNPPVFDPAAAVNKKPLQQTKDLPNEVAYRAVPQENPAKADVRRHARRVWKLANTVEAYEKVGKRNSQWDAAAREALEIAAKMWSGPLQVGHVRVRSWMAAKRAIDAGCDDPFIRYIYVRLGNELRTDLPDDWVNEQLQVSDALAQSGYPPIRKAHAHHNAGAALLELPPTPDRLERVTKRLDACAALLPDILPKGREARLDVLELCFLLHENYYRALGDRQQATNRVTRLLEADPSSKSLLLCVRGSCLIKYAWDARGTGVASTVTPEQWKLFDQRLHEAAKNLQEAWDGEPDFYPAANKMIIVAMGLGWKHEEMDVWFQRAMQSNSDNLDACARKLTYLLPQWFGRWEEMLAFGRKCDETKNWEGRLPFFLLTAHDQVARHYGRGNWLRNPAIWTEIRAFYDGYFKVNPDSPYDRAMCAQWAYRCGQYHDALRLFETLGERDWVDVFDDARAYRAAVADCRMRADGK